MKAQDLRCNNYVTIFGKETQIVPNDFIKWCDEKWEMKWIEPIPLTEEWLLKAGFNILNDCSIGYEYELNSGHTINFFNKELYCYVNSIRLDHIKYIHQLQNLYFALTNEELTIKS